MKKDDKTLLSTSYFFKDTLYVIQYKNNFIPDNIYPISIKLK